jgi:Coenzyme PQQ synthesis protein D (PqqD)
VRNNAAPVVTINERPVVLGISAGAYFDFNQVGAEIWSMLDRPRSVAAICQMLLETHDVDVEVMRQDVVKFLQTLIDHGLVWIVNFGTLR